MFGKLKIQHGGQNLVLGALFDNSFSPRGWQKNSRNSQTNWKCVDLLDCTMIWPFPHTNSMQKASQMHSNYPRLVVKGPGAGKYGLGTPTKKIGFREPGPKMHRISARDEICCPPSVPQTDCVANHLYSSNTWKSAYFRRVRLSNS